jgi:hypothetical protein
VTGGGGGVRHEYGRRKAAVLVRTATQISFQGTDFLFRQESFVCHSLGSLVVNIVKLVFIDIPSPDATMDPCCQIQGGVPAWSPNVKSFVISSGHSSIYACQ